MRSSNCRSTGCPSPRTIPAMPHTLFAQVALLAFTLDGSTSAIYPSPAAGWLFYQAPRNTTDRSGPQLFCVALASLFPFFFHQHSAHRHKDEIEDQNLRALSIRRTDVSLEN